MRRTVLIILTLLAMAAGAVGERIKDVTTIQGERANQLHGFGLVFGLNGTGDNSAVTKRAVASLLRKMNITFDADEIDAANVASVMVTADLGPFDRNGARIDVSVSTIGSASSLQGGKLLMTPLVGADGRVYAVAQGSIVLGGFGATGANATVTQGHLTSGEVPNGAIVEREETAQIVCNGEITILLNNPDHSTAQAVVAAITTRFGEIAHAEDAGTVRVKLPFNPQEVKRGQINKLVDEIGQLNVEVDQPAVVVINEKTGTIIVGQNVAISTVAIAHGNLTITTEEKDYVVQPGPFSGDGATTGTENRTSIKAVQKKVNLHVVPRTLTVTELAQAVNAMGLTPRDMIAIFKAIKAAGALQAELITR